MTLSKGQLAKLKEIRSKETVVEYYETTGGLLAIKVKRHSKKYPVGIDYFGTRGGARGLELYRPDGTKAYTEWY